MFPSPMNPVLLMFDLSKTTALTSPAVSAQNERIGNFVPHVDPDALGLEIFLDHVHAVLTPEAGPFVSAERRHVAHRTIRIHPYRARFEPLRHCERAADVLGPHARGEAIGEAVGDPDRLFIVLERQDRQHGTEHLLARHLHFRRDAREDRGLDKPSVAAFGPARGAADAPARTSLSL